MEGVAVLVLALLCVVVLPLSLLSWLPPGFPQLSPGPTDLMFVSFVLVPSSFLVMNFIGNRVRVYCLMSARG